MFKTSSQARVLNELIRTKEVPSALYSTCITLPHMKLLFLGKKKKPTLDMDSFIWFKLINALRVCLNHEGDSALHFPHPTTALLPST